MEGHSLRTSAITIIFIIIIASSGCYIPCSGIHDWKLPTRGGIPIEMVNTINLEQTSIETVMNNWGEPDYVASDNRSCLYYWQLYTGSWFMFSPGPYLVSGESYSYNHLVVMYDDHGIVEKIYSSNVRYRSEHMNIIKRFIERTQDYSTWGAVTPSKSVQAAKSQQVIE
jgi:hypothetical protein